MGDELRVAAVSDVHHHQTGVTPTAIGDVPIDDRMVQSIAAALHWPVRLFAGGVIHPRQPIAAGDSRL